MQRKTCERPVPLPRTQQDLLAHCARSVSFFEILCLLVLAFVSRRFIFRCTEQINRFTEDSEGSLESQSKARVSAPSDFVRDK